MTSNRSKYFILSMVFLLYVYTTIHLVFFFKPIGSILDVMLFRTDPIASALFNLLGVFPMSFLLMTYTFEHKLSLRKKIIHGLSFVSGAFSLSFGYTDFKPKPKRTTFLIQLMSYFFIIVSFSLLSFAYYYGDIKDFFILFRQNSLIHIMTIDFFVLYILSIIVSFKYNDDLKYVACIPVIGLLIQTLYKKKCTS